MTQIAEPKVPYLYDPGAPNEPPPPAEPKVAQDHRVTVLISMSEVNARDLMAQCRYGVVLSWRTSQTDYRSLAPVDIIAIGSLPDLTELPPF